MAFWKRRSRGSFAPSSHDRMAVIYLGQHPVVENTGLDHASAALDALYRNYKDGREPAQRVTVEVIVNGLVINKIKGFSPPSESSAVGENRTFLAAAKMYFGATDPARPKIFFVVKKSDDENTDLRDKYVCHAFLCESPAAATTLAMALMEMFRHAGDADTNLAYQKSYDYARVRSQQQSREKGLLRSQSLNLPRSRGRPEAVSTLKITMNVELGNQSLITEANNNSEIARMIAERDREQSPRLGDAAHPLLDKISPAMEGANRPASPGNKDSVDMVSEEHRGDEKTAHKPIVAFNPNKPDSPNKLLRESQLSTVKEQSPSPSPKQSPKGRTMAAKKSEDTKENQQVQKGDEGQSEKANKRKSVRFAEGAEII